MLGPAEQSGQAAAGLGDTTCLLSVPERGREERVCNTRSEPMQREAGTRVQTQAGGGSA